MNHFIEIERSFMKPKYNLSKSHKSFTVKCTLKLFADDTKLYFKIENLDACILQLDILRLEDW